MSGSHPPSSTFFPHCRTSPSRTHPPPWIAADAARCQRILYRCFSPMTCSSDGSEATHHMRCARGLPRRRLRLSEQRGPSCSDWRWRSPSPVGGRRRVGHVAAPILPVTAAPHGHAHPPIAPPNPRRGGCERDKATAPSSRCSSRDCVDHPMLPDGLP